MCNRFRVLKRCMHGRGDILHKPNTNSTVSRKCTYIQKHCLNQFNSSVYFGFTFVMFRFVCHCCCSFLCSFSIRNLTKSNCVGLCTRTRILLCQLIYDGGAWPFQMTAEVNFTVSYFPMVLSFFSTPSSHCMTSALFFSCQIRRIRTILQ